MQYAGMTFIIAMIVLYALFHMFWMAPLGIKLLFLAPLFWPFGKLLWSVGLRLWGVYKKVAWDFKVRRMMSRARRMAE